MSVPIDTVAERAGLGVGTLYRHFPTKEALYEAIVMARLDTLLETVRTLKDAADAGEALFSFLREFAGHASAKRDLFEALGSAGIDIKSQCSEMVDEMKQNVDSLRQRAVASGRVPRRCVDGRDDRPRDWRLPSGRPSRVSTRPALSAWWRSYVRDCGRRSPPVGPRRRSNPGETPGSGRRLQGRTPSDVTRLLLRSAFEAHHGHDRRRRHDPRHHIEDAERGVGEIESNEMRDGRDATASDLRLGDRRCHGRRPPWDRPCETSYAVTRDRNWETRMVPRMAIPRLAA